MVQQRNPEPDNFMVVGGRTYRLTYHVLQRIEQRELEREWLADVLENWVARRYEERNRSVNYYGFIPGRSNLLMVAISVYGTTIPTVFFSEAATARYLRNEFTYFDEVRGGTDG
jgi:hypothetical protein